jgi:hypothetical protein
MTQICWWRSLASAIGVEFTSNDWVTYSRGSVGFSYFWGTGSHVEMAQTFGGTVEPANYRKVRSAARIGKNSLILSSAWSTR